MKRASLVIALAVFAAASLLTRGSDARASEGPGAGPAADRTGHAHGETCPGGNILYFRDPSGEPNFSTEPKKNAAGRDYVPVCDDEEVSLDPPRKADRPSGSGKILYYRNPMGLADVSPVPKKDSMGMDYIPVYESEAPGDSNTIKLSVDKIQRSGVRTEVVDMRKLADQVHAYGTVKYDERRLTIVSVSADGIVDDVFVNTIGQYVRAGDPLFRIYSNSNQNIQMLQLEISRRQRPGATAPDAGIQQYLTNVPRPSALDWPSPVTGTVIDKRIVIGQRIEMKDELYRIADLSRMWVIAEVAESDIALVKQGTRAQVVLRAYPHQSVEGTVIFIYPELRQETRTARVTIEVPNPDGRLKAEMYAEVMFFADVDQKPVVAVPESAVIDSGTRQIVLVAKGEGRFEPRPVKLGARGQGYVEVREGVKEGESVVTAATFLIDSESNLSAALKAFTPPPVSP